MRRIVIVASVLASLGVAACDQQQATVQNAQPVAQLPPPPPPVMQPPQQSAPTSQTRRQRASRSDGSFYGEDNQTYTNSAQDENQDNSSDRSTVETRDRRVRAVGHLWTDGFGRQHASTSGEEHLYTEHAANDTINAKDYRDPWFGYDKHCKK
ncbi:MAG: hypothetical protein HY243_09015 [Proteobacteria bacterium]|nr:hypothetical protein [Pseudomonadota bacterium]